MCVHALHIRLGRDLYGTSLCYVVSGGLPHAECEDAVEVSVEIAGQRGTDSHD